MGARPGRRRLSWGTISPLYHVRGHGARVFFQAGVGNGSGCGCMPAGMTMQAPATDRRLHVSNCVYAISRLDQHKACRVKRKTDARPLIQFYVERRLKDQPQRTTRSRHRQFKTLVAAAE